MQNDDTKSKFQMEKPYTPFATYAAKKNIRKSKPGYSEGYYDIFEHLDDYAAKVFNAVEVRPKEIEVMEGETGVILKVFDGQQKVIIKINPYPGDLFTSNYFYQKLENTDIPVPKVLFFDGSKKTVPYDFQVLEHLDGVDIKSVPKKLHRQAGILVGEVLRKIHKNTVDGFGWPLPRGGWGAVSWLDALRKNYFDSSMKKKGELFSPEEINQIEQMTFFNEKLEILEPRLIHSDVGHGNSLYKLTSDGLSLVGFIDPGGVIGGDPMFDVSLNIDTDDDFKRGVYGGYIKGKTLSSEEQYRLKFLRLLGRYWSTCWHYATGRSYKSSRRKTLTLFRSLRLEGFQ